MGDRLYNLAAVIVVLIAVVALACQIQDWRTSSDPCRERDGSIIYYDLKMRGNNKVEAIRVVQCQCVGTQYMEVMGAMCVERHQWEKK